MRTRGVLALALVLVACHETRALPAPDLTGARSMLLAYRLDGALIRVEAFDLANGLPVFSREAAKAVDLVATAYPCPLEIYGLRAGDQGFVDAQVLLAAPANRPTMPAALRAATLHLGDEANAPSAWTALAPAAEMASDGPRRIELSVNLCPQIESRPVAFDPDPAPGEVLQNATVEALTSLGDGRALVITSTAQNDRRAFVVDREGHVSPVNIEYRGTGSSTLPPGIVGSDSLGRLWHVTRSGAVTRGTLEGGLDFIGKVDVGAAAVTEIVLVDSARTGEPVAFIASGSGGDARVFELGGSANPLARGAGFGLPTLGVISADELLVGNLELVDSRLLRLRRSAGGEWTSTYETLPPLPDAASDFTEVTVGIDVDSYGRATITNTFVGPFFSLRGLSLVEQHSGIWQRSVDGFDEGFAAIAATRVDASLLALSGNNKRASDSRTVNHVVVHQRGVGPCFAQDFERGRDNNRTGPAMAVLDESTVLVVPGRTRGSAMIVQRTRGTHACLSEP